MEGGNEVEGGSEEMGGEKEEDREINEGGGRDYRKGEGGKFKQKGS